MMILSLVSSSEHFRERQLR